MKRTDTKRARVSKYFLPLSPKVVNGKIVQYFKCTVENCSKICNGSQQTNLAKHIEQTHKTFYDAHIIGSAVDPIEFAIKRLECIQNCAEIISINGRAFKSLSDSGFKKLIGKKLSKLRRTGYGKGLRGPEYPAVKQHIKYQARRVKEEIREEIKGKFIALMIDTATRNNKTFIGLSLQYIIDGRLVIRCIGMSELTGDHSSMNIKNIIMHHLNDFGINITQVISITTDNAANMIKLMKRLNVLPDEVESDTEEDTDSDDDDENHESELADEEEADEIVSDSDCEFTDWMEYDDGQAELDELLDDNREYIDLVEKCVSELALATMIISGIRCAAHSLQLAVNDALKSSCCGTFIKEIREICKFLRKGTSIRLLKKHKIYVCLPRMDCKTRWSSLYRMVCFQSIT